MEPVVMLKNLCKSYDKTVVNNISLEIYKGEIFGILGPNGAGKTTTLEMMEGLRKPDSGTISILGLSPQKDINKLNHIIGIQFQNNSLQNKLKVKEAFNLFQSLYDKTRCVKTLLKDLDLESYLESFFGDLSGGTKQRLMLALAVLHDPEIIFLDEPSSGLDPKIRKDLWNFLLLLKNEGKTIILTTHYMEEARELCDRIAMFYNGKILDINTPNKLVSKFNRNSKISLISEDINLDLLHNLTSIQEVTFKGGNKYIVKGGSLQEIACDIFNLAQIENCKIDEFAFEMDTLEDLFINLSEGNKKCESV